ncbi:VIT family protein [Corynebacterium felinum]|uniref:VIT1/CCC1 family predicted Fe2+/Mn2+ transporter n=1 Tax=Corynebacterium felinum TaxID=131318 RepID=A0ABU2B6T3_9CORY|nr:VIT family protein [Corynebacterium felinum]MDF5819546.1 VIT family protein [Corynebacterium felinum]MDR7354327.1 VIT1/CCC1 family predicted Fe2+/Mn2+ transporter [Corynebacterium felinum]WJY93703.1 VIT family protein [Corynebacterium felinum]
MTHVKEYHTDTASRLNWLRAGVLGANDGIVSISCMLLGVVAAGASSGSTIFLIGMAATLAGAVSMALGEYVSVSAQRDTERRLIALEEKELAELPHEEFAEMVGILTSYGIDEHTAAQATQQMHNANPLHAHVRLELGIDPQDLTNPWVAAFSSALAFIAGASLPLLAAVRFGPGVVTVITLVALAITGVISAKLSDTTPLRPVARLVIGGALGLAITFSLGFFFGIEA